jgi:hypothetical protein
VQDLRQIVPRDAQCVGDEAHLEGLVLTVLGEVQDGPEGIFGSGGEQVREPLAKELVFIVILMLI